MWYTPIAHLLQGKVINLKKKLQILQVLNKYDAF